MLLKYWKVELDSSAYGFLVSEEGIGQLPIESTTEASTLEALERGTTPAHFNRINFAEIESIDLQEQSAQLVVCLRKGDEVIFPVPPLDLRFEIFHFLNEHPRKPKYQLIKSTFFQAASFPLAIGIVCSGLFAYLYYLATQTEAGVVVNTPTILQSFVASGSETISWMYLAVVFIVFVLLLRKVTSPQVTHRLTYSA